MHPPVKYLEKALCVAADGAWSFFCKVNRIRPKPSWTPRWSDKPLLKPSQKSRPPLGYPRQTDSLCPACVREVRQAILSGRMDTSILLTEKIGEVKATILERGGRILMVKDCPIHGHYEDILAIDTAFFRRMEEMSAGRDICAHQDDRLHNHGSSSIRYGCGAILTVDLTNRCNMMCEPCFTNANRVGFVHELTWEEIKELLDHALALRPRRQMSVQFSGGEPTLSPYFLEAIRYARKIGYNSVQAATNGVEFARRPDFAKAAAEAGLRYAYLQLDGIGNAANSHRGVENLFDVKLQAIENLHHAGVNVVPVITIINGVNNRQVGPMIEFALHNPKKIALLAFQPVSFSGRDETISDERRRAQRYTLSHLARDVKAQAGLGDPLRDWFPISFMSTFTDWADLVHGPDTDWGQVTCGCHPDCGVGMAVMVDKKTKEAVPLTRFLRAEQLSKDVAQINEAGRGPVLSVIGLVLALLRNYDPFNSPTHFRLVNLIEKFDGKLRGTGKLRSHGRHQSDEERLQRVFKRRENRWNFLFIAGMWFQDLFNYDFRRTEMCVIPYGTQEGEIAFCAYNTGVGWRQIVEKVHMVAPSAQWGKEHGRLEVFAGGAKIPLISTAHSVSLNREALQAPVQRDLQDSGIPQNAREEKIKSR